jgi:subtilisin family serine protease
MAMGLLHALRLRVALCVAALVCAGCASGGGGAPVSPLSPPLPPSPPSAGYLNPTLTIPPTPTGMDANEYAANYGVGATGVAAAWNRGITGAGIKIGVIDDGIEDASQMSAEAYQEIVGRVDPASKDINPFRNQLSSTMSHGTELTSLIAGNKNGTLTVGMAYGATVLAVRADSGTAGFDETDLANALNYAVSQGVKVVNFSLGSPYRSNDALRDALAAATAAGVIVVASAGNDGPFASEVNYPGFFSTDPSISHGLIINAGGINEDGTFNTQSNPAGSAANTYLTAPGWSIKVPDFGPPGAVFVNGVRYQYCGPEMGLTPGICQIQGTSYASPLVTGAIALLLQAFPGLTPQQIVQLVLTSTDDTAAPGVDGLTGHGRLNLVKAFQPVGTVAAPVSGLGGEILAGTPIGVSGAAFGDAFAQAQRWKSVGFDRFGRTFDFNLGASWMRAGRPSLARTGAPLLWRSDERNGLSTSFALAETPPPAAARVIGETPNTVFRSTLTLAPGRTLSFASGVPALDDTPGVMGQGHLDFAGYDQSVAFAQAIGHDATLSLLAQGGDMSLGPRLGFTSRRVSALRLRLGGAFSGTATLGALSEDGAVLGASWEQRFGAPPRSQTRFVALSGARRLAADWDLTLQGEIGATRIATSGWLKIPGEIVTTSGVASLRWSTMPKALADTFLSLDGAMTLSLSQPLRVEAGHFSARLPSANEYGRQSLLFVDRVISALPTGRELDASVDYSLWTQNQFSARVNAAYRHTPGHEAGAMPEGLVSMALRYGF